MGIDKGINKISHSYSLRWVFVKGIDYISHCNALRWVLIKESIIFLIVMPCVMGFNKEIDCISHRNALRDRF